MEITRQGALCTHLTALESALQGWAAASGYDPVTAEVRKLGDDLHLNLEVSGGNGKNIHVACSDMTENGQGGYFSHHGSLDISR